MKEIIKATIKEYGLIPYVKTVTIPLDEYNELIKLRKGRAFSEIKKMETELDLQITCKIHEKTMEGLADYISKLKKEINEYLNN